MDREWKNFDDYLKKYPSHAPLLSIQTYFEGVGVLLKKGLIDVDLVYELMPTMVSTFWAKYEPIVKEARERQNYPQLFRSVEYLANEMNIWTIKRGGPEITQRRPLRKNTSSSSP